MQTVAGASVQQDSRSITYFDLIIRSGGQWRCVASPLLTTTEGTVIVSCFHIVRIGDSGTNYRPDATVTRLDGSTVNARVIYVDPEWDFSLLFIKEKWKSPQLGDDPRIGDIVVCRGRIDGNQVNVLKGVVNNTLSSRWLETRGDAPRSGDSGGGVYKDGKFVGVEWGGSSGFVFTPISRLRRALDQLGLQIEPTAKRYSSLQRPPVAQ